MTDYSSPCSDRMPMRGPEVAYAAIGPGAAEQVVRFVREAKSAGLDAPEAVEQLARGLEDQAGRCPTMLMLIGIAMGVFRDEYLDGFRSADTEPRQRNPSRLHYGDTYKALGDFLMQSMEAFGLDPETMSEYLEEHFLNLSREQPWPPPTREDEQ